MVSGYKCFDKGLINRYGKRFEVGKTYIVTGEIKFGIDGNGFHFCKNLEDTLRYFDTSKEIDICKVWGFGEIKESEDNYNGFYDMYASERIFIEEVLSREEIIEYALNLWEERVIRFISLFPLKEEEIVLFKEKFANNINVLEAIAYYQENDKDVYRRKRKK